MNEFDAKADHWEKDPGKIERAGVVAAGIAKAVPLSPRMAILDYGCGTGLLGFALSSKVGRVSFADSSPGMLAVLQGKIAASGTGNMKALRFDILVDTLPEDRFDLVCTLMTLHHIPDVDEALKRFHSLLKADGHLCISDLDLEDGSFHGTDFSGHQGFSREALARQVIAAGFQNPVFSTVYTISKIVDGAKREFPVFLLTAQRQAKPERGLSENQLSMRSLDG